MPVKQRKIELVGQESLSINEARSIIKAAMIGASKLAIIDYNCAMDAVEKIAYVLVSAGQDKHTIQTLITGNITPDNKP